MIKSRINKIRGFSLFEAVIYVALLSLILTFVFTSALGMYRAATDARASRDINNSAVAALDRIVRAARDSSSVHTASSTLATSPGALALNSAYASGGEGVIRFYVATSSLYIKDGTASAISIIAPNVSVQSLIFYRIVTPNGEGVRMILGLSVRGARDTIERTYYTTVMLRESYQ